MKQFDEFIVGFCFFVFGLAMWAAGIFILVKFIQFIL